MSKSQWLKRNSSDVNSNIKAHTPDATTMIEGSLDCTITTSDKNKRKRKDAISQFQPSTEHIRCQLSFPYLTKSISLVHEYSNSWKEASYNDFFYQRKR